MKSLNFVTIFLVVFVLAMTACNPATMPEPAVQIENEPEEKPVEETVEKPTEVLVEPSEVPTEETVPTVESISADVQIVEFSSTDGTLLKGEYYPPETGPAPVVVLMHQYPLDHETEWFAIAPWLQNRGLTEGVTPNGMPWGDSSWFPAVPEDLNVGVFTFTFRGCQGGCQNANLPGGDHSLWAEDARAALLYASNLPGADTERIVAVGTSIGADGVVDGCWLAEEDGLHCVGAMSWSPGSYLGMSYDKTVGQLTAIGTFVRCFAGEADTQSAEACRSFAGEGYQMELDPSSRHGIALVDPDLQIETLDLLLAFLQETVSK
jgi:hypothetical protein